ncbi:hypothetical protein [Niabella terrae]
MKQLRFLGYHFLPSVLKKNFYKNIFLLKVWWNQKNCFNFAPQIKKNKMQLRDKHIHSTESFARWGYSRTGMVLSVAFL